MTPRLFVLALVGLSTTISVVARADGERLETEVRRRAAAVEQKLIHWRRDIHQNPELGDQETRTSKLRASGQGASRTAVCFDRQRQVSGARRRRHACLRS